eukprot:CAMPEP_0177691000 /NCGR_PEP_ID=MMETSP0484_2-20121128/1069_1 /TAXON_ID=354590 /ORGANISM="Rhodomonas lens, Strain RHODO" /LENGTH=46 /DNA_ID= /DNA_START= /DNA_END= /DNA_ORIENTATION=
MVDDPPPVAVEIEDAVVSADEERLTLLQLVWCSARIASALQLFDPR